MRPLVQSVGLGAAAVLAMVLMVAGDEVVRAPAAPSDNIIPRNLKELSGVDVYGAKGEKLGKIEGLAIDAGRGQIAYAVLSYGGIFNMGSKEFAVPWTALRKDLKTDNTISYALNVDKDQLKNAKSFDKENWPAMADESWGREVHTYWHEQPYWERPRKEVHVHIGPIHVDVTKHRREPVIEGTPVSPEQQAAPPQAAPANLVVIKSEDLNGHNVVDTNGVKLGEIKSVFADAQSGRLLLSVIKISEVTGFSKDARYPIPSQYLQVRPRTSPNAPGGKVLSGRDSFDLVLNIPIGDLRNKPSFSEDGWPAMTPRYVESIYRAYSAEPFWSVEVRKER